MHFHETLIFKPAHPYLHSHSLLAYLMIFNLLLGRLKWLETNRAVAIHNVTNDIRSIRDLEPRDSSNRQDNSSTNGTNKWTQQNTQAPELLTAVNSTIPESAIQADQSSSEQANMSTFFIFFAMVFFSAWTRATNSAARLSFHCIGAACL